MIRARFPNIELHFSLDAGNVVCEACLGQVVLAKVVSERSGTYRAWTLISNMWTNDVFDMQVEDHLIGHGFLSRGTAESIIKEMEEIRKNKCIA